MSKKMMLYIPKNFDPTGILQYVLNICRTNNKCSGLHAVKGKGWLLPSSCTHRSQNSSNLYHNLATPTVLSLKWDLKILSSIGLFFHTSVKAF